MQRWEFTFYIKGIYDREKNFPDGSIIWRVQDKTTGKTTADELQEYGSNGWEVVSVAPLNYKGDTLQILFTLKRHIEDIK